MFLESLSPESYIDILDSFDSEEGDELPGTSADLIINGIVIDSGDMVDWSWFDSIRSTWYSWVRGLFYIMLIIYNINQIYKLIRGTALISFGSGKK